METNFTKSSLLIPIVPSATTFSGPTVVSKRSLPLHPSPPHSTSVESKSPSSSPPTNTADAIYTACETGDVTTLSAALRTTPAPIVTSDLLSPAHVAARNNSVDCLRLLQRSGANVFAASVGGATPLHLAASYGAVDALHHLLTEAGGQVDAPTDAGFTPLCYAAQAGRVHAVTELLELGADVEACVGGRRPTTVLHLAAEGDSSQVLRVLLEAGAAVDAVDHRGGTPLHSAARLGRHEVVRLLIEGAPGGTSVVDRRDGAGCTALHLAAACPCPKTVTLLLTAGANVQAVDGQGRTPLDLVNARAAAAAAAAAANNQTSDGDEGADALARVLEACSAVTDLLHTSLVLHETPDLLVQATVAGDITELRRLLRVAGHALVSAPVHGVTPLISTCASPCSDDGVVEAMAEALLAAGAAVGGVGAQGETPMHAATRAGRMRVVALLMAAGGDPNARDVSGKTPLDLLRELPDRPGSNSPRPARSPRSSRIPRVQASERLSASLPLPPSAQSISSFELALPASAFHDMGRRGCSRSSDQAELGSVFRRVE